MMLVHLIGLFDPLFQIYSEASGRLGSSTLHVKVMAWPLTTISVSLLIKACPGGSARPKIHIMRVDFMTVNGVVKGQAITLTCSVDKPRCPEATEYILKRGGQIVHDVSTFNWTF